MSAGPRVAVVGCGSIGLRHIRNLVSLGVQQIVAIDPEPARSAAAAALPEVTPCASLALALDAEPDAVLVCTPPSSHVELARLAIEAGAHVFVEKPLGVGLDGVDNLITRADAGHRVLLVGYNLRFHPGLRQLKRWTDEGVVGRILAVRAEFGQYLPDWRPGQDYRAGYNARAADGGGIILDASHELDYARWLGGEVGHVYCAAGHLSDLETEPEDYAAITLEMIGGIFAEVHLDCLQRAYARSCKVIGEQGTLLWDYNEGVRLLSAVNPPKCLDEPAAADGDMYVAEMRHFLACIRGEAEPVVDASTGRRVLEIALAARESARLGVRLAV